jgi:hypothetical protein
LEDLGIDGSMILKLMCMTLLRLAQSTGQWHSLLYTHTVQINCIFQLADFVANQSYKATGVGGMYLFIPPFVCFLVAAYPLDTRE